VYPEFSSPAGHLRAKVLEGVGLAGPGLGV
jgi:hypothetical protein